MNSSYPTNSQIAFRLRKLRTIFTRFDLDKDRHMSKEDFELMAKKLNELSNANSEEAESRRNAFQHCADIFGFTPGVFTPREEAVKNMNKVMLKLSLEEQRTMSDNILNPIFDAMDLDRNDYICLNEFKTYTQVLALDLSKEDKNKAFNLIDSNQDGEISRDEFLKAAFEYLCKFEENELSKVFYGPLVP